MCVPVGPVGGNKANRKGRWWLVAVIMNRPWERRRRIASANSGIPALGLCSAPKNQSFYRNNKRMEAARHALMTFWKVRHPFVHFSFGELVVVVVMVMVELVSKW